MQHVWNMDKGKDVPMNVLTCLTVLCRKLSAVPLLNVQFSFIYLVLNHNNSYLTVFYLNSTVQLLACYTTDVVTDICN